ncbi:glycerate kinase [Paratractidigestivibacter sp.]|uniref:glycerate kinase family protein n=1 Tax=Paratractidigestivibacter sp. TaxID=2847316 RepID=UPI002ABDACFB|nr:glycerate kinase [Paratractidigestivibacter sp.]
MAGKKFVFASDSFKGTLSSQDTARLLSEAASEHFPGCECVSVPMADGGEGTTAAVVSACGGELRRVYVHDPLGRAIQAELGLLPDGRAIVETAAASGLPLLDAGERDPRRTSTYGTGELIRVALDAGARKVSVALGGSATNDGGMGAMRALGARFLDAGGDEFEGTGADLARVCKIDLSGLDDRLAQTTFVAMCDVDNPLLGEMGATMVFGPQKGADVAACAELEAGMRNYARVLADALGFDTTTPGAGAAGGLGAACQAFLGARMKSGVEQVMALVGLREALAGASVCVTGEGHADAQTARGKVVSGVAAACADAGVPCVAIVGGMDAGAATLRGVTAMVPTQIDAMPLDEILSRAEELYALAARRVFSLLAVRI